MKNFWPQIYADERRLDQKKIEKYEEFLAADLHK